MEFSPTAYVILGMLAWGPRSGYDIKADVDKSVRFFWAASYGQIYPELKRLSEAGLIEGQAQGGRRRTVYRITDLGAEALEAWLTEAAADVRDPRRGPAQAVPRRRRP